MEGGDVAHLQDGLQGEGILQFEGSRDEGGIVGVIIVGDIGTGEEGIDLSIIILQEGIGVVVDGADEVKLSFLLGEGTVLDVVDPAYCHVISSDIGVDDPEERVAVVVGDGAIKIGEVCPEVLSHDDRETLETTILAGELFGDTLHLSACDDHKSFVGGEEHRSIGLRNGVGVVADLAGHRVGLGVGSCRGNGERPDAFCGEDEQGELAELTF